MIKAKINVTAIDKSRLFSGAKGTYLDIVLIETPENKYGDYIVLQQITREERAAGVEAPILGNAHKLGSRPKDEEETNDLPF